MAYMRDATGTRLDDIEVAEKNLIALAVDNSEYPYTIIAYTILPLYIAVPPTENWVEISWNGSIQVGDAGDGLLGLGIGETTSGSMVEAGMMVRGGTFTAGAFSAIAQSFPGAKPVPPSPTWRTYCLLGAIFQDPGSSLSGGLSPSSNGVGTFGNRSAYLKAVELQ